jgi:hypothetical protein
MEVLFGHHVVKASQTKITLPKQWLHELVTLRLPYTHQKYQTVVISDLNDKTPHGIKAIIVNIRNRDVATGLKWKTRTDGWQLDHPYLIEVFDQAYHIEGHLNVTDITEMTRQFSLTLTDWTQFMFDPPHKPYVKPNMLSPGETKYCDCLLEVQAKGTAVNPYAVCTHSVGAENQVHRCGDYYDFEAIKRENPALLVAFADLHHIKYASTDPQTVLNAIYASKSGEHR